MFTDKFVRMHIAKASLRTEERKKDERFPVLGVALVLEPLTLHLAKQLGPAVVEHCFTPDKTIRDEMTSITIRLREQEQAVTASMAEDVAPHCVMRQVRLTSITIARRGEDDKVERKGKKIAPQQATLRLTLNCLFDPADRIVQEFFCGFIGDTFLFGFEPEERDLFAGVHTDDDVDDADDDQGELDMQAPTADDEAGDVLDEQPKKKRGRKPRLVKGDTVNGSGPEARS